MDLPVEERRSHGIGKIAACVSVGLIHKGSLRLNCRTNGHCAVVRLDSTGRFSDQNDSGRYNAGRSFTCVTLFWPL